MSLELREDIWAEKTNIEPTTNGTPYISGLEESAPVKERRQRRDGQIQRVCVKETKQSLKKKGVVNNVECC